MACWRKDGKTACALTRCVIPGCNPTYQVTRLEQYILLTNIHMFTHCALQTCLQYVAAQAFARMHCRACLYLGHNDRLICLIASRAGENKHLKILCAYRAYSDFKSKGLGRYTLGRSFKPFLHGDFGALESSGGQFKLKAI